MPSHPFAEKAAEAARCAGMQGKYWEYHDALYSAQNLDLADLKELAKSLGLNNERFNQCLDSGGQASAVAQDLAEGEALGITGTPSFFVNGHFTSGTVGLDVLRNMIDQELNVSKGELLTEAPAAVQQHISESISPISKGKWTVIVPPVGFDKEDDRYLMVNDSPTSEWTVLNTSADSESDCRDSLANHFKDVLNLYSKHPKNDLIRVWCEASMMGKCLRSDGSEYFRPHEGYVSDEVVERTLF